MIYDLTTEEGIGRCKKRLNALVKKQVRVEVKLVKPDGDTNQMRKYWHAMIRIIANDIGYSFESFKEAIIIKLGFYDVVLNQKIRHKTSEMNKDTYMKLIDAFLAWCIDEGYWLPTQEEWEG